MDIKKLQTLVVDALEDVKGQDIAVFETSQQRGNRANSLVSPLVLDYIEQHNLYKS